MAWLRNIFGRLTRHEAEEIAKAECVRRGWPWGEPVSVQRQLLSYRIMTNANRRGGNVNIFIDARTGAVLRAGFARR